MDSQSNIEEIWKPIPGYEGSYEVSNQGRVKSLQRKMPRILRPASIKDLADGRGHLMVRLSKNGVAPNVFVHHLVLRAFVGLCPEGSIARHLDDEPTNNRLDNLRWGTRKENALDAIRNERYRRGITHPKAKLTEQDIRDIRRLRQEGIVLTKIAERFGITYPNVRAICARRTWKHVL